MTAIPSVHTNSHKTVYRNYSSWAFDTILFTDTANYIYDQVISRRLCTFHQTWQFWFPPVTAVPCYRKILANLRRKIETNS